MTLWTKTVLIELISKANDILMLGVFFFFFFLFHPTSLCIYFLIVVSLLLLVFMEIQHDFSMSLPNFEHIEVCVAA